MAFIRRSGLPLDGWPLRRVTQFADQRLALASEELDHDVAVQGRHREADLGRDEGMPVAVSTHPTGERKERPLATDLWVGRPQLRVEGRVEVGGGLEDGPLEIEDGVLRFVQRAHPTLANFLGLPESLEDFVRSFHGVGQTEELAERRAATGLGGMRGQDRLDFQQVEALLNFGRRNLRLLQFPEQTAQRLGGLRRRLEVPNPGALLAEIDQLKKQAEGVRHLVSLGRFQVGHHPALGLHSISFLLFPDFLGQDAELLEARV